MDSREFALSWACPGKKQFEGVHHFYHQLCVPCAEQNWAKRTMRAPLQGMVALLTGGASTPRKPFCFVSFCASDHS